MNYTKASISRAVRILKDADYIYLDPNKMIFLTEKGEANIVLNSFMIERIIFSPMELFFRGVTRKEVSFFFYFTITSITWFHKCLTITSFSYWGFSLYWNGQGLSFRSANFITAWRFRASRVILFMKSHSFVLCGFQPPVFLLAVYTLLQNIVLNSFMIERIIFSPMELFFRILFMKSHSFVLCGLCELIIPHWNRLLFLGLKSF